MEIRFLLLLYLIFLYQQVQAVVKKYDILFIVDEVFYIRLRSSTQKTE
jgi:hypothetical protein